jgi:hypothetical protein
MRVIYPLSDEIEFTFHEGGSSQNQKWPVPEHRKSMWEEEETLTLWLVLDMRGMCPLIMFFDPYWNLGLQPS